MALGVRYALALVVIAGVGAGTGEARAEVPRVFLLPVRGDSWLVHDERLLEARVALALQRTRRVRVVAGRDLSPGARQLVPADLGGCVTPACLGTLARATGAVRVLALELFAEGDGRVLMATLFDPASGEVVDRRELPRASGNAGDRGWADEVARWVAESPVVVRAPPVRAPAPAGVVVSLAVAPEQAAQPEAQALVARLRERLTARGRPKLALPQENAAVSHHAVVTVEKFAVWVRPHHLRHYRHGVLAANLVITEARTGTVIFTRRASVELDHRARHSTDQWLLDGMVTQLVHRWMIDLEDPALDRLLRRPQP